MKPSWLEWAAIIITAPILVPVMGVLTLAYMLTKDWIGDDPRV